jgi:hypothetical protein
VLLSSSASSVEFSSDMLFHLSIGSANCITICVNKYRLIGYVAQQSLLLLLLSLLYRYNNYKTDSGQQLVMYTKPKLITLETKPEADLIRSKHIV